MILTIALLSVNTVSSAETMKVIKLKDGSVLKGNVLQLSDGVYTFETSNLGEVDIEESDILSITSSELSGSSSGGSITTSDVQKRELQKQVQQIKGTILADEEILTEIQNMVEDESIKTLLSDPQLLKDVMSFDQQKIEQNTNVQELMDNPKMQELMDKIQQKYSAE